LKEISRGSWFTGPVYNDTESVNVPLKSASFKKLSFSAVDENNEPLQQISFENAIVSTRQFPNALETATVCAQCKSGFR